MTHLWLYRVAGCMLLLTAALQLYSAYRAAGGAALSKPARLRRRASLASGGGAALYGGALLYQRSDSPERYPVFIAGAVVFALLVFAGVFFNQRARQLEARNASAADRA
jgi:hypothetical protein